MAGEIYFQNPNASEGAEPAGVDAPLPVINSPHLMIHRGKGFFVGHIDLEVASPGTLDILIQTGASSLHAVMDISGGGDATFTIYEDVTFSDAGTPLTIFNKARWSTTLSLATATAGPTIIGLGTAFPSRFMPGGSGGNATGGSDGSYNGEFDMASNKSYLFRITNEAGQVKPFSNTLEWYEPDA